MTGSRHRWCRIGCLILVAVASATAPRAQSLSALSTSLARYATGQFAAVDQNASIDLDAARRVVRESVGIGNRAKSAWLLEEVDAFDLASLAPTAEETTAVQRAVTDAEALVRVLPATDAFTRAWYRAALAALEGPGVGHVLLSTGVPFKAHVDAGEFALGHALSFEEAAWLDVYSRDASKTEIFTIGSAAGALTHPANALVRGTRSQAMLSRALSALEDATKYDTVRGEAYLRQAALVAFSGDPERALVLFDRADQGFEDDWVQYLSALLRGRALEDLRRTGEAQASYRRAIDRRPRARSAHLALAALTFATGAQPDAELARALDRDADALDPWAQYSYGGYRFWFARRADMRGLIR